jgi:hypothetical protein
VYCPSGSAVYCLGEKQGSKAWNVSLHKRATLSLGLMSSVPEKVKVALVELVDAGGPESMDATGGVMSTTNDRACEAPTFPAASRGVTLKVCEPSASTGAVKGEEQERKVSESTAQSNAMAFGSVEEKVNAGAGSFVGPVGPESIVVSSAASAEVEVTPRATTTITSRLSAN